jgi:hypothetical protein
VIWLLIWQRKRQEMCDMPRDVAMLVCAYICSADAYERNLLRAVDDADAGK